MFKFAHFNINECHDVLVSEGLMLYMLNKSACYNFANMNNKTMVGRTPESNKINMLNGEMIDLAAPLN